MIVLCIHFGLRSVCRLSRSIAGQILCQTSSISVGADRVVPAVVVHHLVTLQLFIITCDAGHFQ